MRTGGVAQVLGYLLSKHEDQSSNPRTTRKKEKLLKKTRSQDT
jgi:hypothetical protein